MLIDKCFGVFLNGEPKYVTLEKEDANTIKTLLNEQKEQEYRIEHEDEYGEDQLDEMVKFDIDWYTVLKLKSTSLIINITPVTKKAQFTDEYKDKNDNTYDGSDLEDVFLDGEELEKFIEELEEEVNG